jgi:UDP-N-acetylmuramoylalanine--D-glutamate ligase
MSSHEKIIIMGFGKTGKSLVNFFLKKKQYISLYEEHELSPQDNQFLIDNKIKLINNQADPSIKENYSKCFVSPGFDLRKEVFNSIDKKIISNDISLINEVVNQDVIKIAITGTNGKTTVCSILEQLLNYLSYPAKAVGNIGYPILSLKNDEKIKFLIVEISSFQLETLSPEARFNIASILNIEQDHMDRYDDFEDYKNTKLKLIEHSDYSIVKKNILNEKHIEREDVFISAEKFKSNKTNHKFFFKEASLEIDSPSLIGEHNGENIYNVLLILKKIGIDIYNKKIKEFFLTYKNVPHRIELVGKCNGATFYDDSKATNLASTNVALKVFNEPLLLILGGLLKGQSLNDFNIPKNVKKIYLFGRDGKIFKDYFENKEIRPFLEIFENLDDLMKKLFKDIESDDIVLLSPGCASMDLYKNYQERGAHFKALVQKYKNEF